jgi:phosphate transport system substrate-binding protein
VNSKRRILAGALALTLVAAACGSDDSADNTPAEDAETTIEEAADDVASSVEEAAEDVASSVAEDEETASTEMADDMEELSGEINISGSSTVEPISVRVQELFNEEQPTVNITVDGPRTGDCYQLFCAGETDNSDASRAISDEEIALCEENGVEYTELQVGIDGIALMTNPNNTAVTCLTFEQIYGLVGPESTGFGSWSDANDLITEVGGEGNLPDAELVIFGPGEESGTFDSFVEIVLEDIAEERGQDATTRPDYNPSANDNVILEGITSSDTSFGWVGFAFAEGGDDVLIEADGGDGCVAATAETIASNEYPISRPLFIYVNNASAADKPEVAGFVDFYLSTGLDTAVSEVGYVALADDAKVEVRAAWSGS